MNRPTETPQQAARRLAASAIRDGYEPEALHTYTYPDRSSLRFFLYLLDYSGKGGTMWCIVYPCL
jgi:hypothetical protein